MASCATDVSLKYSGSYHAAYELQACFHVPKQASEAHQDVTHVVPVYPSSSHMSNRNPLPLQYAANKITKTAGYVVAQI